MFIEFGIVIVGLFRSQPMQQCINIQHPALRPVVTRVFINYTSVIVALLLALLQVNTAYSAAITQAIKIDSFGYRTQDTKIAVFSENPGTSVEVRDTTDDIITTLSGSAIQPKGTDTQSRSGDTVWWVDFSNLTAPGNYRLYSSSLNAQSYDFKIADNVYNDVVQTALKTFYLQRCNTPKHQAHVGSAWSDALACHMSDLNTGPASGHTNHGSKDLTGGWHDAGDYNKYVWTAVSGAILTMLTAYEDNPDVFTDDLNLPESGNGRPDILDEIKWELDWLLKMQLSDGSVLYQTHVDGFGSSAPPSTDTNVRYYQNPTLESGSVFAGTLALSARIFAAEGDTAYANTLLNAAKTTWTWLQSQGGSKVKVWAAAELFRADPTLTSAKNYVDGYYGNNWQGAYFDIGHYDTYAAITYIQTPAANTTVTGNMRVNFKNMINGIFSKNDLYRIGMQDWSYHWGSNAIRANYGLMLLTAAKIDETGNFTTQDCLQHAQDFLHYFHGQNPLNMTYLTNMTAQGGNHSSWQFYHAWFGDSRNSFSASNFIGKPSAAIESDYPYLKGSDNYGINDSKISTYGPPPGFVPGGPNQNYSASSIPPLAGSTLNPAPGFADRYYRDWNWNPATNWQNFQPWEITESSIGYQGPYVALGAYFMEHTPNLCSINSDCDDGLYCNGAETCDTVSGACITGANPCNTGETCDEQSNICTIEICNNNGTCETGEDCNNCANDCISGTGGGCGNGICEPGLNEDCQSCPQDCSGVQSGKPSKRYCCGDGDGTNPVNCSDNRCTSSGFSCSNSAPTPYCCGDTICTFGSEDSFSCALDCGSAPTTEFNCTDGVDNDADGQTDCSDTDCIADSACQSSCDNDGICEAGEDCSTCPSDCNGKTGGKPNKRYCCGDGVMQSTETGAICDNNF